MVIMHNLGQLPDGIEYDGEISELGSDDIGRLSKEGIDECWYWYAMAPYEGDGQAILRKGILYEHMSLCHCSCYEPTDKPIPSDWQKLDQLEMKFSGELLKEVKPLLEMARKAKENK